MVYSNDHVGDINRFFDLASKQMKISRDIQWTWKFYANRDFVSIPNYNHQTIIKITSDTEQIEEMTLEIENDPDDTENQNENIVWMT